MPHNTYEDRMSAATTMTEAETERAARARIDRLNDIRRAHAERRGIAPGAVVLTEEDFDRANEVPVPPAPAPKPTGRRGGKSEALLAACARLADRAGNVSREALERELGATDPAELKRLSVMICNLRSTGRMPYAIGMKRHGPAPGARAIARPSPAPPRPAAARAAPEPPPQPTVPAEAPPPPSAVPSLASTLAILDRLFDGLDPGHRAVAAEYVTYRFGS